MKQVKKVLQMREFAILLFIVVFLVAMVCVRPKFLSEKNIFAILISLSATATMVCGMCVLLVAGCMDLSVGSTAAMTGCLACMLMNTLNFPVILAVLCGVLCGVLAGLINGFIVIKWNISPFIVTLGTMYIFRGVAQVLSSGYSFIGLDQGFLDIGQGKLFGVIQYPIIYCAIVVVVFWILLKRFRFFRQGYFVGGNEKAAAMTGMKPNRIKVIDFAIMGGLSGWIGVLLASRYGYASSNIAEGMEMDLITACVIGGSSLSGGEGSIFGAFLGALLLAIKASALNMLGVETYWQNVATGGILLLAVIVDTVLKTRKDLSVKKETAKKRDLKAAA